MALILKKRRSTQMTKALWLKFSIESEKTWIVKSWILKAVKLHMVHKWYALVKTHTMAQNKADHPRNGRLQWITISLYWFLLHDKGMFYNDARFNNCGNSVPGNRDIGKQIILLVQLFWLILNNKVYSLKSNKINFW